MKIAFLTIFLLMLTVPVRGQHLPSSSFQDNAEKSAARGAIEDGINRKIRSERCRFVNDSTVDQVRCGSRSLDDIILYLSDWQRGLKETLNHDVDIYIHIQAKNVTLAQERAAYIKKKFRSRLGFWDYYVTSATGSGNDLELKVRVN